MPKFESRQLKQGTSVSLRELKLESLKRLASIRLERLELTNRVRINQDEVRVESLECHETFPTLSK